MHISSLPSEYGIGKMGKQAFDFVDFLVSSETKCWQILPLSPTSYGDSPYQSFSVNAGNPYFIDFELLEADGLLEHHEFASYDWGSDPDKVDYSIIYQNCFAVLRTAYSRFKPSRFAAYKKFCEQNKSWLEEYALFMALKSKNGGKAWYEWEGEISMHKPKAVTAAKKELKKEMGFYKFLQFEFSRQWTALKKYANDNGIEIIGDIPIYCALDSVEAWSDHKLFEFDRKRRPIAVAGCPPDDFSPTGQLWGNPLYNWEYHKKTGYKWWIERIRTASELYDIVRIDHFRGFESYYTIPFGNEDATVGEWKKGPNYELFRLAEEKLGKLNIIAEDLGFITPEVREMLDKCGYPGMKVPPQFCIIKLLCIYGNSRQRDSHRLDRKPRQEVAEIHQKLSQCQEEKGHSRCSSPCGLGKCCRCCGRSDTGLPRQRQGRQNEHPLNSRLQLAVPHP